MKKIYRSHGSYHQSRISKWVFLQNLDCFDPGLITFNVSPLITLSVVLPCHQRASERKFQSLQGATRREGAQQKNEYLQPKQRNCWEKQGADTPASEVTEKKLSVDQRGPCRICRNQEATELSETKRKQESNCNDTVAEGHLITDLYSISSHLQISLFKEKNC